MCAAHPRPYTSWQVRAHPAPIGRAERPGLPSERSTTLSGTLARPSITAALSSQHPRTLPSSNGQDARLSTRKRRFNSGWEYHPRWADDSGLPNCQLASKTQDHSSSISKLIPSFSGQDAPLSAGIRASSYQCWESRWNRHLQQVQEGGTSGPTGHGSFTPRPPGGETGGNISGCSGFDSRHEVARSVTRHLPRRSPVPPRLGRRRLGYLR